MPFGGRLLRDCVIVFEVIAQVPRLCPTAIFAQPIRNIAHLRNIILRLHDGAVAVSGLRANDDHDAATSFRCLAAGDIGSRGTLPRDPVSWLS